MAIDVWETAETARQPIIRRWLDPCRTDEFTNSRKRSGENGFSMKLNTPEPVIPAGVEPPALADINITGASILFLRRKESSSRPLVPGISTSLTTQSLSHSAIELKKPSAVPKTLVEYPLLLRRSSIATLTLRSSSITDISGYVVKSDAFLRIFLAPSQRGANLWAKTSVAMY